MDTEEVEKIDTLQKVELAEGVEIRLRMVGPMLRMGAYLIDLIIRMVIVIAGGILAAWSGFVVGGNVVSGIMMVSWFLLDWFYSVVFEAGKRGATPGKRMLGLRVVQTTGAPITLGQAIVRNFLRFADSMPFFTYGFGFASCLATKRFQRLGDLAAGTVVIYDKAPVLPTIPAPPPMIAVPVPIALGPDEMRALAYFRDRAGLWSEGRKAEMTDQLSELSGARGAEGVKRIMAMAHWLHERKGAK